MKHFISRAMLALSSAAAIIAASCSGDPAFAQVINPSQPATGVPVAGTGISVAGQTVSVNYGLVANTALQGNALHAPTAIGDTTPNTAAFTTLSATGAVSGAGFSSLFASPFAIGSTAPNTGAFTTLANSSTFTSTGASILNGTVSGTGIDSYVANHAIVQSVATVAALQAAPCVVGLIYQTRGYYASNGVGAGSYLCTSDTTTPTNGGTILAASNTDRLYLQYNGATTTTQWGAHADGSFATHATGTDDTAPIQAAITWSAANNTKLIVVGANKVASPLTFPTSQLYMVGAGSVDTFDSGIVYTGTGTMVTGAGVDKSLVFVTLENLAFDGPGAGSGVNGFYGDFYEGGATHCVFRAWGVAVQTFGSLNTFTGNRFVSNGTGMFVTAWPAGSSQAGVGTTSFQSIRNDYNGNTTYGLRIDSTTTGGANFVSSGSHFDVFEVNGTGLLINKSFAFVLENPHFEQSTTNSLNAVNSAINSIMGYYSGTDASKISITFPGASANGGGYTAMDSSGVVSNSLTLSTQAGHPIGFTPLDSGQLALSGSGIVGTWTPVLGSSTGTQAGNTFSLQEGNYLRLGSMTIATFRVVMTAKDAGMTGVVQVSGLPFASSTASNAYGNAIRFSGVTFAGGAFTEMLADVGPTSTAAQLIKVGSALAPTNLTPAEIVATSTFSGTIIYLTP